MKPGIIIGALLIVGGLYLLVSGASFTKDKTVAKVGSLEANVKQTQTIPPWTGGIAIIAGIAVIAVGMRKS